MSSDLNWGQRTEPVSLDHSQSEYVTSPAGAGPRAHLVGAVDHPHTPHPPTPTPTPSNKHSYGSVQAAVTRIVCSSVKSVADRRWFRLGASFPTDLKGRQGVETEKPADVAG